MNPPVPRRSLSAALLGFFIITLDALVVSVALPAIRDDVGGGLTGLQWVVDGYTLPFAALLLLAGTLSDRVGARRAFGAGVVVFIASSIACALAPSLGVLIGARLAQGAGAGYAEGLRHSFVIAGVLLTATALASLRLRGDPTTAG